MVKQVIVMRKDLNMRKGKMIAQACHASLNAFLSFGMNKQFKYIRPFESNQKGIEFHIKASEKGALYEWWTSGQTKITVGVNSEEELLDIYESIPDHIPCYLVTDAGRTEFNGVPTKTCLAIGPAPSEIVDLITGHLKLL